MFSLNLDISINVEKCRTEDRILGNTFIRIEFFKKLAVNRELDCSKMDEIVYELAQYRRQPNLLKILYQDIRNNIVEYIG